MEERRELEIREQRITEKGVRHGAQLQREPTKSQSGGCGHGNLGKISQGM